VVVLALTTPTGGSTILQNSGSGNVPTPATYARAGPDAIIPEKSSSPYATRAVQHTSLTTRKSATSKATGSRILPTNASEADSKKWSKPHKVERKAAGRVCSFSR
jgi:hypothetical protein